MPYWFLNSAMPFVIVAKLLSSRFIVSAALLLSGTFDGASSSVLTVNLISSGRSAARLKVISRPACSAAEG